MRAEQPTLADAIVTLRPVRLGDAPDIVLACRDPETLRWTTIPTPYDDADARSFVAQAQQAWQSGAGAVWAMTPSGADDRWSGAISIGVHADDPVHAEVGFNCAPWACGQGLTTAALRLMCAWALDARPFKGENLARIQWSAYDGNDASRLVAERVGFVVEGTQRQRLVQRGTRRDSWVGALLPGDLQPGGRPPGDRATSRAPEVHAADLLLSPWREQDAPQVLEIAEDQSTRAWSGSMRSMRTLDDARTWIRSRTTNDDRVDWAVRDAASGRLVGRVGLHRFDRESRSGEIGYGVHPAHRRRGVALRAVTAATAYGFESLGLQRITLIHAIGNSASCAVASAAGFGYEGIERSAIDHGDGVLHDVHRHARLASDPPGPASRPRPAIAPVELAVDGLLLRPWHSADAAVVLETFRDPEVARWNARPPLADLAEAHAWVSRRQKGWSAGSRAAWAVCDATSGELLGSATLRDLDRAGGWGVASYWVRAAHRGRGVATRALDATAGFGFDQLGLHRVALFHALANVASCRVAEKAGFALEGTVRGSDRLAHGEWVDEHVHGRLAGDPPVRW